MVDYGGGNIRSVIQALHALEVSPELVAVPEELAALDSLIFPGQGAFGSCMEALQERDLVKPIQDWIAADRPFFGICVGYQLLFEEGEENPGVSGLGVLKGRVVRFPDSDLKVPQMGWNSAQVVDTESPFWDGLGENPYFYFVHSYHPVPEDDSVVATRTSYGLTYASSVQRGNLLATQFHPEKSQKAGMKLLSNFLGL